MWDKTIEEVLEKTNSSKNGLTKKQALQRLMINGKNKLPKGKEKTILDVLIDQFKSPIILILIIAAIFSIFIGSFADAIFIIIVISINAR